MQMQFFKFIAVGGGSAIVDVAALMLLLHIGLGVLESGTIAFFSGFIFNYYLHTKYTFLSNFKGLHLIKFCIVVFMNYCLSIFFIWFSVYLGYSPMFGKCMALPLVAANGFILSKYWVYRNAI